MHGVLSNTNPQLCTYIQCICKQCSAMFILILRCQSMVGVMLFRHAKSASVAGGGGRVYTRVYIIYLYVCHGYVWVNARATTSRGERATPRSHSEAATDTALARGRGFKFGAPRCCTPYTGHHGGLIWGVYNVPRMLPARRHDSLPFRKEEEACDPSAIIAYSPAHTYTHTARDKFIFFRQI